MSTSTLSPRPVEAVHTRAAKGGLVSGVSFAVNLGLNLVQVPLLLRFWPQETYGLWLSVGALSSLLTSLDGGHQAYVGNLLNHYHVKDRSTFSLVLTSAVRVAALTSTLQIALTLALCFSGKAAQWLSIDHGDSADFALAVAIYTVGWISTGSINSILVKLYIPAGLFVRSTWWAIAMRVMQLGSVVVSAWLGWGLLGATVFFTSVVFAVNIFIFADIYRLFPEFFPWWRGGNFLYGLKNFSRSTVLSFVSILDLFSLQGVVLLVTGCLGALVVPLFTTLRTLANIAMQGTGFLLNPIQPDLVRYHVASEGKKIAGVFGFFWFATSVAINASMVVGLFFVEPLYRLWTRGRLEFDRSLFAWLAAAVLIRTLAAPMQTYLAAINHLRALAITSVVRALLTVGGVIGLAPFWKLGGVGAALFVSEAIGSLLLSWWFTRATFAGLGSRLDTAGPRVAALSAGLACFALGIFGANVWYWPWVAAGVLLVLSGIAVMQWRALLPEVQERALLVGRPLLTRWRIFVPAR